MANDDELTCHRHYVDMDMMNKKQFSDNFNISDISELSNIKELSMLHNNSIILSSTLHLEDDECQKFDNSIHSPNSSEEFDPMTSTPERKISSTGEKYKMKRPPNLIISEVSDDRENFDIEKCSPVRSPYPESDDTLTLDDSFVDVDEKSGQYNNSSSKIIALNKREKNMLYFLKKYGLGHLAFTFIEQEIDVDLFLTLSDYDLQEIGIERKGDRNLLLAVIEEYNSRIRVINL